ncbi:MAG: hypothetical protein V4724_32650 [Pseudomonadota bacterium]
MQTKRRSLLKIGVLGGIALAAGGAWYRRGQDTPPGRFALDGEARAVLAAIIPALLDPLLPAQDVPRAAAIASTTDAVRQAINSLPLATQKEVQDLFGLLALAPARRFLAGVPAAWSEATPQQVSAFLQDWRLHRLGMLQSAYHALHDLVLGAWYAQPASWAGIGYPGPIKELS